MCTEKTEVDLVTNLPKSESKFKSSKKGLKSGYSSPSPHALKYYKPVKNSKNFTSQSHVHNWIINFLTDGTQSVA